MKIFNGELWKLFYEGFGSKTDQIPEQSQQTKMYAVSKDEAYYRTSSDANMKMK